MRIPAKRLWAVALATTIVAGACTAGATPAPTAVPTAGASSAPTAVPLSGEIRIDGSSTVFPVTEAIAEEFQAKHKGVRVAVAFSGTGGGFQKFCAGETDANDASRPITTKEKTELCPAKGILPVELKVAIDGLTVVVHKSNTFATCMTTGELKKVWDQGSTIQRWNEIRPEWPNQVIKLYGPGADSGTFDYFTEVINGKAKQSRSDYTQSESDFALVSGVSGPGNDFAFGYFGYHYFKQSTDKLNAVQIDGGKGCIAPNDETINNGTYAPLSRPLFVYPSAQALKRPEVAEFFRFYLNDVNTVLGDVGYIPLPDAQLKASKDTLEAALK